MLACQKVGVSKTRPHSPEALEQTKLATASYC